MKWSDYLGQAKDRGALALELFVVRSAPAKSPSDIKAALPGHLAYQAKLESSGSLVFAGPMSDESGEEMQGMGLIILRAESFEAARALADNDPMHATGARSYVLRRWMINEGSFTVSVGLSTKTVGLS